MTPKEEQMLNLRLDKIMDAIQNQAAYQVLKDENIMNHLTALSAKVEANMDLITIITNKDREVLIETRDNTRLTNGRVTKLENAKNDHIIYCPRVNDIKVIEDKFEKLKLSVEDLTFVQRHPILFTALIVATIFVAIYFKSMP